MKKAKAHIEDFLTDPEFKEWVLNPSKETNEFWKNWIASHPQDRKTILYAREVLLSFTYKQVNTIKPDEKTEILQTILRSDDVKSSTLKTGKNGVFITIN